MYTNPSQIKAKVVTNWTQRSKFKPGDTVRVLNRINSDESSQLKDRIGCIGTVVAVSVADDGLMRGSTNGYFPRQFTRYYVQFPDNDQIIGFHSHYLELADRSK